MEQKIKPMKQIKTETKSNKWKLKKIKQTETENKQIKTKNKWKLKQK